MRAASTRSRSGSGRTENLLKAWAVLLALRADETRHIPDSLRRPWDWISVALAAAPVLREALERLRNANEVRRFFYEFRAAVEDDNHVPHDAKGELAERLFYLLADPNFQSALDNYLERLDITEASSEIESFVRPLVEELVSPELLLTCSRPSGPST
jgi:hypothetical protein